MPWAQSARSTGDSAIGLEQLAQAPTNSVGAKELGRCGGPVVVAADADDVRVDPGVEIGELDAQASAQLRRPQLAAGDRAVDSVRREAGQLGDLADSEQPSFRLVQELTSIAGAISGRRWCCGA